jgi:DMSO reductase anchor subunit
LFLAYYSAEWFVMLSILAPAQTDYSGFAAGLSFLLLAAGLLASFFHLGHPERAWRAAAVPGCHVKSSLYRLPCC